jgi:hypothetical protein
MTAPSLRTNAEKSGLRNKKAGIKRFTAAEVRLGDLEIKLAIKLGDGDLTLGVRRAVVFASMRQF